MATIYAVVHSIPTQQEKLKLFLTRKEAVKEMEKIEKKLKETKKFDVLGTVNPHRFIKVFGNEWYSIRSIKTNKVYIGDYTKY